MILEHNGRKLKECRLTGLATSGTFCALSAIIYIRVPNNGARAVMLYQVDVLRDVVLLIDAHMSVVDAFDAAGETSHQCEWPVQFYTYRSLLIGPGYCLLCGTELSGRNQACTSSGGYHAFVGCADREDLPDGHKVEHRNLPVCALTFDEFTFYLERDNLFSADEIRKPMVV